MGNVMPFSEETKDNNPVMARLELIDIHKYFDINHVLQGVSTKIHPGEIIGLVGPNGAGKSTLMRIITGVFTPDSGKLMFNGQEIALEGFNPLVARQLGISCAYQELSLCSNLSVYENFAVSNIKHNFTSFFSREKWKEKNKNIARELLESVFPKNNININSAIEDLTLAQKQVIEITRAMSLENLKILILDEPTSSLSNDRIDQLHSAIRRLAETGVSIYYISHKLDEVKRITNRIVILKNGLNTWEGSADTITAEELVTKLGGTITACEIEHCEINNAEKVVEIKDFTTRQLKNINMYLKEGEIVGLAGLAGSGQKYILDEIFKAGRKHRHSNIEVNRSVSYISGDRQNEGIFNLFSVADNILISSLKQVSRWGLISKDKSKRLADHWYEKLNFKATSVDAPITDLSGGNQQKALIARGIASQSDILLLDDPTRGVDIETKQNIYALLREARKDCKTILWHSTEDLEMEECDRVYVIGNGAIIKELTGSDVKVEHIVGTSFQDKNKTAGQQVSAKQKSKNHLGSSMGKMMNSRSTIPIFLFIVLFLLNGGLNPNSMSYSGLNFLFSSATPMALAAIAQMFLVMAGDIDFGLGYAIGMVNVLCATFLAQNFILGLAVCVAFIVCYTLMGVLIHVRKIPAIIVTLGASFIWLGIALIVQPDPGGSCPAWLTQFYQFQMPVVPFPLVFCIIAAVIPLLIIKFSKYGMVLRGIGNNPKAISMLGWSYFKAHIAIYALAAVFIVLAGLSVTAISNGSDANASNSYTLSAVAIIIIGGCKFSGGVGEPIGVVVSTLAIMKISSLLSSLSVDSRYQTAVIGIILIIALALRLLTRKKAAAI